VASSIAILFMRRIISADLDHAQGLRSVPVARPENMIKMNDSRQSGWAESRSQQNAGENS
jgi:hypothetical protein